MCDNAKSALPRDPRHYEPDRIVPIDGGGPVYTAEQEARKERLAGEAKSTCASEPSMLRDLRRTRTRLETQRLDIDNKLYTVRQLISLFE